MDANVLNVLLGVVSSAVSATLAWLVQTTLRRRGLERKRRFFGLTPGADCALVVPRHMSGSEYSVNRRDALALMELATLVKECGARAELLGHDQVGQGLGARTEFCIGGPVANSRTEAHLSWKLPGVTFHSSPTKSGGVLAIGSRSYTEDDEAQYVLLSRITAGEGGRPAFLIAGQSALANIAGGRYLSAQYPRLAHRYGTEGTFALLLRVVRPSDYGADVVELVGDVTEAATAMRPEKANLPSQTSS